MQRMERIGLKLKLDGNYPWIYIRSINGKPVMENFQGNHGFTIVFYPKKDEEVEFTDTKEIFNLIRKYIKPKLKR